MIHKMHDGEHLPSVLGVGTNVDGSRNYAATPAPYELVDDVGTAHDFSAVAFPVWPNLNTSMPRDFGYSALTSGQKTLENTMLQGATQCSKCHGDPDGSGPMTAPAQGDIHRSQPSRRALRELPRRHRLDALLRRQRRHDGSAGERLVLPLLPRRHRRLLLVEPAHDRVRARPPDQRPDHQPRRQLRDSPPSRAARAAAGRSSPRATSRRSPSR
jgi:hypothetical protein